MKRLAVFFSCLSLASVALSQSQPSEQESIVEAKKPPLQATVEADTKLASSPSESREVIKPPAKKVAYGGVLLKLLQSKPKPQENTADPGPAEPLRGLQWLNPFAPMDGRPVPRLDWKAHRPVDHRFQSPKTGEPEGIKLFMIGF